GDDDNESARTDGDAAFGEVFAKAFDRTADALLRGVFAGAEGLRYLARRFAFKVAQQQRVAVRLAQLAKRGVEMRGNVLPSGVGFAGKQLVHSGGLLFAGATAHIGADGLRGDVL